MKGCKSDAFGARVCKKVRSSRQAAALFNHLPHIWWGVSVEDRVHGLPRVEHLRQAPAVVRFLSVEPLLEDLGEINLEGIHWLIVGGEAA
jgi:protein gp37